MSETSQAKIEKANPTQSVERMIYHTTYKKGAILGCLHFETVGTFEDAKNLAKDYCTNHGLKHIHTVPFLINIKEQSEFHDRYN